MHKNSVSASDLLRLVGLFGIAVGIAWAVQTLFFGECDTASRLAWVVATASMSGAGAGLVVAAHGIGEAGSTRGKTSAA